MTTFTYLGVAVEVRGQEIARGRPASPRGEREHGHGGRTLVLRLAAAGRVAGPSTFPLLTSVASVEAASNPPAGCRRPATALANEAVVTGVGSHPSVELVPRLPGSTNVVLVRRATTVPFTAVPAGPQRTATDNATAASTCAIFHRRRWQSCPIWLWEQGVAVADAAVELSQAPQLGAQ